MEVQPAPTVDSGASALQQAPVGPASSAQQSVQGVVVAPAQSQAKAPSAGDGGIAPAIAKLFGGGDPQPIQLNVSYRVEGKDIVTVFTDPKSGKEVAQFPAELLIGLAKFFDQQSGVTLDQTA